MMTSAPKATPSTVSRSRSRPTSTRSTTSCRKKGIAIAKTSSASDRTRICASVPLSPRATPRSCVRAHLLALVARLEARGGRELHRHARVVARGLVQRHHAPPARRVVHDELAALHGHQHHEVVHVPVQHRRQLQLAQRLQRRLHAARREPHALGDLRHVLERHALERGREAHAHRREVGEVAVVGGHHGEAGDAALRAPRSAGSPARGG